ncbi:hypothetical protein K9692_004729 [Escherichia coli]|nr:hypothetical protein [Escherichia coli]
MKIKVIPLPLLATLSILLIWTSLLNSGHIEQNWSYWRIGLLIVPVQIVFLAWTLNTIKESVVAAAISYLPLLFWVVVAGFKSYYTWASAFSDDGELNFLFLMSICLPVLIGFNKLIEN